MVDADVPGRVARPERNRRKPLPDGVPPDLAASLKWVIDYAADRARRGIPETGIYYDGEDPMRNIKRKAGHN